MITAIEYGAALPAPPAAGSSRASLARAIGLFLIPVSQLVPNHYPPWTSFHQDAFAIAALLMVGFTTLVGTRRRTWPSSAVFALVCALVPLVQFQAGLIYFLGDAVMPALYLTLLALSIAVGSMIGSADNGQIDDRTDSVYPFFLGLLATGLVSVGIALYQWLLLSGLYEWAAEVPPGASPFANLGQPNLLGTLTLASVAAAHELRRRLKIGDVVLAVASVFLVFGTALTHSRTAWIGLAFLTTWLFFVRPAPRTQVQTALLAGLPAAFVVFVAAIPLIGDGLGLESSRTVLAQFTEGRSRLIHWATVVDALMQQPLLGYGWNQISVAQARAANGHPWSGEFIEHSHNALLDLLAWNGMLMGLLLIAVIAVWAWRRVRVTHIVQAGMPLAVIAIVLIHSMFEYPLDYATFLVPLGLLIGVVESLSGRPAPVYPGLALHGSLCVACSVVAAWVAVEYMQIESNTRTLRLESARIGVAHIESLPPDVVLLTQQRELLRFARTEATRGMSPADLTWMKHVAERFGHSQVLFRYAVAAGLNGDSAAAAEALERLCKTQARQRCDQGEQAWRGLAAGPFPELATISFPKPMPFADGV